MPTPESEQRRLCITRLMHVVQRLALDAPGQIEQERGFPLAADEMALDFGHWFLVCTSNAYIDQRLAAQLKTIDDLLTDMSGPQSSDRWTLDALGTDPGWTRVRERAKEALHMAGWRQEVPPTPDMPL